MMKFAHRISWVGPAALLLAGLALAQQSDPWLYTVSGGSSSGGPVSIVNARSYPLSIPVLTGQPFYGELHGERHQVLLDGTHIDQIAEPVKVWRDSAGRTRVERQPVPYLRPASLRYAPLIVLFDPFEGFQYVLDPELRIAHRSPVKIHALKPLDQDVLARQPQVTESRLESAHRTVRTEQLGTQVIAGLTARGTRTTITIDPGALGSDDEPEIVVEQWYSVDLQIELLYKCPSKGSTDNIRRLTNVNRDEPNPLLFQVPTGYTVVDETGDFKVTLPRN